MEFPAHQAEADLYLKTVLDKLMKLYTPIFAIDHMNFSYVIAESTAQLELEGGVNELQEEIISFFDKALRHSTKGYKELPVSHILTKKHTITLELLLTNPDGGTDSELKLSLPIGASQKKTTIAREVGSKSVLIFEQDEMSRLLADFLLKKNKIRSEISNTLKDAKEKLAKGPFNLVILGIDYPGAEKHMHDLLEEVKKNK